MKAPVFDIQRFSLDDGPGIRSVVFFGGCPLRCLWCHNPEGLNPQARLTYNSERCVSCGICVVTCPRGAHSIDSDGTHQLDRAKCISCGACTEVCAETALNMSLREMSVDEVADEVLQDAPFYENSGGGVTLSGGEPLIREDFVVELVKRLHGEGVSVAVETSGYVKEEAFSRMARDIDMFLFDFKESDPERHMQVTGVDPQLILKNLDTLDRLGRKTVLRCPLIPCINDREDHAKAIASIAEKHPNIDHVEIMPYHSLGLSKYAQLGYEPQYDSRKDMSRDDANAFVSLVKEHTAKRVVVG